MAAVVITPRTSCTSRRIVSGLDSLLADDTSASAREMYELAKEKEPDTVKWMRLAPINLGEKPCRMTCSECKRTISMKPKYFGLPGGLGRVIWAKRQMCKSCLKKNPVYHWVQVKRCRHCALDAISIQEVITSACLCYGGKSPSILVLETVCEVIQCKCNGKEQQVIKVGITNNQNDVVYLQPGDYFNLTHAPTSCWISPKLFAL